MGQLEIRVTGVSAPLSFDYTSGHGFVPGVMEIECAPQSSIPGPVVSVFISDGFFSILFRDCLVDYSNVTLTTNGHVERLNIFDRRWRWHNKGEISGTYNVRNPDNTIVSSSNRAPQMLAVLAFQALQESNFTVSQLPNEANDRPFVAWECESPQEVLEWLCERSGCDVAPNWHTNDMVLVRLGQGNGLPTLTEQSISVGFNRGMVADAVKFCCGYTRHQSKFKLEAMGQDTDGKYKPHAELSYGTDLAGLGYASRYDPLPGASEPIRTLAKKAFKTFRIMGFADGTWNLPTTGQTLQSRESVLPLRNTLLTGTTAPDGSTVEDPAFIDGVFMVGLDEDLDSLVNTEPSEIFEGDFRIDLQTGLVFSSIPAVKLSDDDDTIEPAELYLTTSHRVRDNNAGHAYARYTKSQNLGFGAGTPPFVVRRDDLHLHLIAQYPSGLTTPSGIASNQTSVDGSLESHLDALLPQFATMGSDARRYAGIVPIALGGVIRQVRWRVQCGTRRRAGGAWTWAYANCEAVPGELRLHERRRLTHADGFRANRVRRQLSRWSHLRGRED